MPEINLAGLFLGPGSGRSGGDDAEPVTVPPVPGYTPSEPAPIREGQFEELLQPQGQDQPAPAPPSSDPTPPPLQGDFILFDSGLVAVGGVSAVLPPAFTQRLKNAALECIAEHIRETTRGKVQAQRSGEGIVPERRASRKRAVRKTSRKAKAKSPEGTG